MTQEAVEGLLFLIRTGRVMTSLILGELSHSAPHVCAVTQLPRPFLQIAGGTAREFVRKGMASLSLSGKQTQTHTHTHTMH